MMPKWPARIVKSNVLFQYALAIGLLSAWEITGRHSSTFFFLLGTPLQITIELVNLVIYENFLFHFLVTAFEAIVGLLIGTTSGLVLGLSLWFSPRIAEISRPYVIILGSLPIVAFAPLMIIWFGIGIEMKVILAAMSTFFIAFNQASRGIGSVSEGYIEVTRGMNFPKRQTFIKVVVPASMEWVFSSMRLSIGFALLGAFIGEFIASDRGLGYIILRASALYNVPRAIAAAAGIALLAIILDNIGRRAEAHRHLICQWVSVPRQIWR